MTRTSNLCLRGALPASCALIALATSAWCAGPDWVLLDENRDSRFYYDQNANNKPHGGIVRVGTRVVYTEEGKAEALGILKGAKKLDSLFETRYRHDLDCSKGESRLLEATHLDRKGVTLKSSDLASKSEWEEIPPGARMDLVLELACGAAPLPK